jgi:hypothetical protein
MQVGGTGSWFVAVGSAGAAGAEILWFEATNGSLSDFKASYPLYQTNKSFVTGNHVDMFECPDVFELGGKVVVFTSVEGDTQWLVGDIKSEPGAANSASPRMRFVPHQGGMLDQGVDFYAAKSGAPATLLPRGRSRRLSFAFNGWGGGSTQGIGCGRYLLIPRELSIAPNSDRLHIAPVAEVSLLRRNATTGRANHLASPYSRRLVSAGPERGRQWRTTSTALKLGARSLPPLHGGRLELQLNCSVNVAAAPTTASSSSINLDFLASSDRASYARVSYDCDTSVQRFAVSSAGMRTTESRDQPRYVTDYSGRLNALQFAILIR